MCTCVYVSLGFCGKIYWQVPVSTPPEEGGEMHLPWILTTYLSSFICRLSACCSSSVYTILQSLTHITYSLLASLCHYATTVTSAHHTSTLRLLLRSRTAGKHVTSAHRNNKRSVWPIASSSANCWMSLLRCFQLYPSSEFLR